MILFCCSWECFVVVFDTFLVGLYVLARLFGPQVAVFQFPAASL